jgi:Tol biopolymer transport system component
VRGAAIALLVAAVLATAASAARETTTAANGKLAFVRNGSIYVVNANGSALKRLTRPLSEDYDPAWSPAGNRIAFARNCGIYVMNSDGKRLRRLTRPERLCAYEPTWSPDGSRIAFVKRRRAGGLNAGAVYVMGANGKRHRALTQRRLVSNSFDDSYPAWSPDGSRIAFARTTQEGTTPNPSIYVINLNGTGLRELTRAKESMSDSMPSWSPDGQWVAFGRRLADESWVVGVVGADGSGDRSVKLGWRPPEERDPAWSPDGRRIAFMGGGIGLMDPDGTDRVRLTSHLRDKAPAWQPLP